MVEFTSNDGIGILLILGARGDTILLLFHIVIVDKLWINACSQILKTTIESGIKRSTKAMWLNLFTLHTVNLMVALT